ncbi:hypothetical protein BYI23_B012400 [Burkholderia sp. YI23]|nr:hypothetical protein BYI23_B012400 [Burkholderia sp. YI23]
MFVAHIDDEEGRRIVYGCAAPALLNSGWHKTSNVEIPGGLTLHMCESVISSGRWNQIRIGLEAGVIDTAALGAETAVYEKIRTVRHILQDAFGQTGVPTQLNYTLPDVEGLFGEGDGALARVLNELQSKLNLPFEGRYATHLGNFEVFDLHPWLDSPPPFLEEGWRNQNEVDGLPQTREICRSAEFCQVEHIAQIVSEVNDEVIFDKLIKLPAGQRRVTFELSKSPSRLHFRLYSASGAKLLHSEQQTFLRQVHLIGASLGRQLSIEDELSRRAKSQNKELGQKSAQVVTRSSFRSSVGSPRQGSWQKFADDMERRVATQLPKSAEDKWFPRGIESEIGAIAHLTGLIDGGRITHAILVDPWFGAEALHRFALRLSSHDVRFTILTSWTEKDPDTGDAFERDKSPTAKLEAVLHGIQEFLAPSLRIINLVDGRDQAFHDRYLVLYPHDSPPKVFLLSNSINKLAGNWPFAMSLLAPDVGRDVRRYVEALLTATDSTRSRPLNITFEWPSHAA